MFQTLLTSIFGSRNSRLLKQYRRRVARINALEPQMEALSDDELRGKTREFQTRIQEEVAAGKPVNDVLDAILPEAFAVCREGSKRILGMRHFDVQMLGAMVLNAGKIAEMRTGEGKTLTATLVDMFKDPDLNTRGAQIVFTTHDTALLDNSPVQLLEAGEVWMTEKSPFGASDLFSLADFPSNRKGTNKQRRYLAGAFGAIPRVDTSSLRRYLSTPAEAK